jgi:hypothetical protein
MNYGRYEIVKELAQGFHGLGLPGPRPADRAREIALKVLRPDRVYKR